jgi:hypothetical protein
MAGTQGNENTSGHHDSGLHTPGFSPGGGLNPAIGIERPEGGSSRDLSPNMEGHTVGSPAGPSQVMSPPISRFSFLGSGGRRAGTQSLFEFGETATNRSLISPRGLQHIVESVQSIDEMKSVFIHQLTAEGGVIDRVRVDHEDTSIVNRETIVMNQAVRDITANIASRLPQECAALLEKALLEVYDILAPRICTYFNIAVKSDGTI